MPRTSPTTATQSNVRNAFHQLPEFHNGQMFRLDTFAGQVLICHPLGAQARKRAKSFHREPYEDSHTTMVVEALENANYTRVKSGTVDKAIMLEAYFNSFSSALEIIENLPDWDQIPRLDKFFFDVCGVEREPEDVTEDGLFEHHRYHAAIARALFVSMVARITVPGCKADNMVVLEGPQGTLKSTLLRAMCFDREELFSDSMPHNLGSKDARQHLLGKLIIEFGEVNQMRASRAETVKSFLSARDDKFRPPYGRHEVMRPRQCIFVGTSNAADYLVDDSGNRRFWPIACGKIDIDLARGSMEQLWAEAWAAKQAGEQWHLSQDLEVIAAREQAKRLAHDPWEAKIAKEVDQERQAAIRRQQTEFLIVPTDCLQAVGVDIADWDQKNLKRVNAILRKLGGKNSRLRDEEGQRKRAIRFDLSPIDYA